MNIGSGSALVKAICVAAVAVVMLIPLGMLRNLVEERTSLRTQAVESVARGWGGRQLVGGPVIAVPVTVHTDEGKSITRDWYVLPESLEIEASLEVQPERRKVGMYQVPVFEAWVHARARFDLERQIARYAGIDGSVAIHPERARLLVPISDPRGVRSLEAQTDQSVGALEPARGFPTPVMAAPLPPSPGSGLREIGITLQVAGTESLAFMPLARSTSVKASGNWPHPGFARGFLPIERHVTRGGFDARWQVLDLNRSYGSLWLEGQASLEDLAGSAFGIDIVQPADLYQQITRSVKYAGLFVSLSLLTLFLFERIANRRLHPIEYGLLALALGMFYLLLLALAEHIGFKLAYLCAAAALCALIGVYLAGVLRSRKAGGASAGIYGVVYGLLYLLVTSEDYSLLTGALALFTLLATLMLLTRKVDWYGNDSETG